MVYMHLISTTHSYIFTKPEYFCAKRTSKYRLCEQLLKGLNSLGRNGT